MSIFVILFKMEMYLNRSTYTKEISRALKGLCLYLFFLMAFLIIPPRMLFAADMMVINYTNMSTQKFAINRNASMIRRIMFDDEKSGDRIVLTYYDDTHQVFKLKSGINKIKRLVFESTEMPSGKAQPPREPAAVAAPLIIPDGPNLGSIWTVTESCGGELWTGVWTRREGSSTFDAVWKSSRGKKRTSIVGISEISDGRIKLYREDTHGYYDGLISHDGKRVINGWASWYEPNCLSWFAVIR